MKKFYFPIIASLIMLAVSCSPKIAQRVRDFPQERQAVKQMPEKENLWVFIMAGQSNMAGRGMVEAQDTLSNPRILSINQHGEWVEAKEPLHYYEPNLTGLDCGLSFGKELIQHLPDSVSIALIPCAVGGSAIQQWLGDSTFRNVQLMSNFEGKVDMAKQFGQIKGILWHQGESDATDERIALYPARLDSLAKAFRNYVGDAELPMIVGELGAYTIPEEKKQQWARINEAIHQFAEATPYVGLVSTSDLKHKGDYVHFNSASQRMLGKRYAEQYLKISKQVSEAEKTP